MKLRYIIIKVKDIERAKIFAIEKTNFIIFRDISLDLYKNTIKNSMGSNEQDKEIFQINEKFSLEDCISKYKFFYFIISIK